MTEKPCNSVDTVDEKKKIILDTVRDEKPKTTQELLHLVQLQARLSPDEIIDLLVELENSGSLHFSDEKMYATQRFSAFLFSRNALWFLLTVILAATTAVVVLVLPQNYLSFAYVRLALGTIFVLFLPGYTFVRLLFPEKVPLKTSSQLMDTFERIALSFGMSLALVPISGLLLNYTPFGLSLLPDTVLLLVLTMIFAVAAITREYQSKSGRDSSSLKKEDASRKLAIG